MLDLDLDSLQVEVEVEYVPEKAELDDALLDDFKAIFEKFTFKDAAAAAAEGMEMLSLGSLKTGAVLLLLFPTADAALLSSMLSIGDALISGICIALALCIAVLRGSKNRFFNCTFMRYTVSLTVTIIIMNWFQAAQPALQYVASGVIGFVAVQCLWNGGVKQLMGKVWDGCEHDATALPEDCGDCPEDGSSTGSDHGDRDHGNGPKEDRDHGNGPEEGSSSGSDEDHGDRDHGNGPEEGSSSGSDEDIGRFGPCAVQLLSIRANFHVSGINAFDWHGGQCIYRQLVGEVQEEGMVDLVPIGPYKILEAYGPMAFQVYPDDDTNDVFLEECDVDMEDDEVEERTQTIDVGLGRMLEITYLVMPDAIEAHVEVRLNLKDLGSRSRNVYGSIKASAIDYGSKSVHLFSCYREGSLSFPCGSTCVVPLSPFVIALPYRRHFKLHMEVDLRLITTCDSQEEDKNLKFCLDFTRRVTSQEREVDGDQVEMNITWYLSKYD